MLAIKDIKFEILNMEPSLSTNHTNENEPHQQFDNAFQRNVLWQSPTLTSRLENSRVMICGMGGLGWVIGASLVTLGVKKIHVFDPDCLEANNLNRLWGCNVSDVGQYKVDLFKAAALGINKDATIRAERMSIPCATFEDSLQQCDVVFGALDRPEPRLAIDILSRNANVRYIDSGTAISVSPEEYQGFGQVYISDDKRPRCIVCSGMRQSDIGYRGEGTGAEPSSGVLNAIVGNLAVSAWLKILQNQSVASLTLFDWREPKLTDVKSLEARPDCNICGPTPTWVR